MLRESFPSGKGNQRKGRVGWTLVYWPVVRARSLMSACEIASAHWLEMEMRREKKAITRRPRACALPLPRACVSRQLTTRCMRTAAPKLPARRNARQQPQGRARTSGQRGEMPALARGQRPPGPIMPGARAHLHAYASMLHRLHTQADGRHGLDGRAHSHHVQKRRLTTARQRAQSRWLAARRAGAPLSTLLRRIPPSPRLSSQSWPPRLAGLVPSLRASRERAGGPLPAAAHAALAVAPGVGRGGRGARIAATASTVHRDTPLSRPDPSPPPSPPGARRARPRLRTLG